MKLKDFYQQDGSECVIQDGGHQQWKYRVSCTLYIYWYFEGLEYCFWNCTLRLSTHKQYFFQMVGFIRLSCWKMSWLCEIGGCHIGHSGDRCLWECCAICCDGSLPVFWRNLTTSLLRAEQNPEDGGGMFLWSSIHIHQTTWCSIPEDNTGAHYYMQVWKMWFHFSAPN
jgi:hypothetical protein